MSVVEEIKQRLDIVDVIGGYLRLQKAGRTYKALCPFHTEKTPSFVVSPERQSWHCFGACSEGGDLFTFVQKREGLEFRDALRLLAERAGVPLSEGRRPHATEQEDLLRRANEAAARFFHEQLLSSAAGAIARDYLRRRGVTDESARAFQLGYAPESWDDLRDHLTAQGFASGELVAAGLLSEGERGPYDRFRGRLMFPIRDERGRVAGFGGRALAEGQDAKYLNTPQTPIFDKGGLLYALDRAREEVRGSGLAVVVEGYMDAIAAHEHGFTNVVASMGTALTERQVALLKRYTRNLALALDADAAGSEATLRGIQVAAQVAETTVTPVITPAVRSYVQFQETLAADLRVVALPEGKDPDEVIRADPEGWRRLVEEARPVLDHLLAAVERRFDLSRPRERSRALDELLPVLRDVRDPVVRAHYLQRTARLLQTEEEDLRRLLRPPARRGGRPSELPSPSLAPQEPAEEYLLALLFAAPVLRQHGLALAESLFTLAENRELWRAWCQARDLAELRALLDEALHPHLERVLAVRVPPFDPAGAVQALESCQTKLQRLGLVRSKRAAGAILAEAEETLTPRRVVAAAQAQLAGEPPAEEEDAQAAAHLLEAAQRGLEVHGRPLERDRQREAVPDKMKAAIRARFGHHRLSPAPEATAGPDQSAAREGKATP